MRRVRASPLVLARCTVRPTTTNALTTPLTTIACTSTYLSTTTGKNH
jgi:hypothetical protein